MDKALTATEFYNVNIHEKRFAAYFCRALPLLSVLIVSGVVVYGAFENQLVLIWLVASLNVALWLWVVTTNVQGLYSIFANLECLEDGPQPDSIGATPRGASVVSENGGTGGSAFGNSVVHLVVLPNYKEDESMLAETLRALGEAETAGTFVIVLAMEAREGKEGKDKAIRLQMRFECQFAGIIITDHPDGLMQDHADGSAHPEVPGKASNLKWAVEQAYKDCIDKGVHPDRVLLTVADADCIFHPLYFSRIGNEFAELRAEDDHHWTMWQAPQLPLRNFYAAPIVSRVWAYVASSYEFGSLSGCAWGGHSMIFSSYSMPLMLGRNAEAWDGDVIAEDHHAWLKCFYYWLYRGAQQQAEKADAFDNQSKLRIVPVFLPVKSTSVQSDNYWKSWQERWSQAVRHAQGVAELCYALLATYDALRTCLLPHGIFSISLFFRMTKVIFRLWCIHLLPICQTICLVVLSIKWFLNDRNIPYCPNKLWLIGDLLNSDEPESFFVCGFAGAWVLTWPVVIPWMLTVMSNILLLHKCFLRPAELNRYGSIWHSEDGKPSGDRPLSQGIFMVICDCIFGMSWILIPYGFITSLLATFNVLVRGNSFDYVCASKGVTRRKNVPVNSGSVDKPGHKFQPAATPREKPIMIA